MKNDGQVFRTALFSGDRRYRYVLKRIWQPEIRSVNFVMLNPSTADENDDDPTIRRCVNFARSWGCGGVVVTNLFAYRATDPLRLAHAEDPIGPLNDTLLEQCAATSLVVCAWGNHGIRFGRYERVRELLAAHDPHYLRLTKLGQPQHPLYLSAGSVPVRWLY